MGSYNNAICRYLVNNLYFLDLNFCVLYILKMFMLFRIRMQSRQCLSWDWDLETWISIWYSSDFILFHIQIGVILYWPVSPNQNILVFISLWSTTKCRSGIFYSVFFKQPSYHIISYQCLLNCWAESWTWTWTYTLVSGFILPLYHIHSLFLSISNIIATNSAL